MISRGLCPRLGRAGGLFRAKRRPGHRSPTDLPAIEGVLLAPRRPTRQRPGGPRQVDLRQVRTAVLALPRPGCQWRRLPCACPAWGTGREYVDTWTNDGAWARLHDAWRDRCRVQVRRQAQPRAAILDRQTAETTAVGGAQDDGAHTNRQRAQATRAGGRPGASPAGAGPRGGRLRERQGRPVRPHAEGATFECIQTLGVALQGTAVPAGPHQCIQTLEGRSERPRVWHGRGHGASWVDSGRDGQPPTGD